MEFDHCASSSTSTSNNSCCASSDGPLYELDDLMAQLPFKRGLSKFYNGKSQTFASLLNVESVEELGKRETMSLSKRIKSCKSYAGDLNIQRKLGPNPTIAKRSPKISCSSSFAAKTSFFVLG